MKRGAWIATLIGQSRRGLYDRRHDAGNNNSGRQPRLRRHAPRFITKGLGLAGKKRNEVHHFNDVASYAKGNDHYWQSLGCTGDSMVDESPGYLAHSVASVKGRVPSS